MKRRRELLLHIAQENYIDLGLPSGVLWASGNICKDSNDNYYIGKSTDYGCYFSWGNIDGHNINENYNWGSSVSTEPYVSTPGATLKDDIPGTDPIHNAAFACLGEGYRLPSSDEFQELIDNCTCTYTTNYKNSGVAGQIFRSNISGYTDKEIFFPAAGCITGQELKFFNSSGEYWTQTYNHDCLYFHSSLLSILNYVKYYGATIRPIIYDYSYDGRFLLGPVQFEAVDLGLPNNIAWSTVNNYDFSYAADLEYDMGGLNYSSGYWGNYIGYYTKPTKAHYDDLLANTDKEFIEDFAGSGVAGLKLTSKKYPNRYIFFPAYGYINHNGNMVNTRKGYYPSNTSPSSGLCYGLVFDCDAKTYSITTMSERYTSSKLYLFTCRICQLIDRYDSKIKYLESSGTQYINIKTPLSYYVGVRASIERKNNSDVYILGTRVDSGDTRWCIGQASNRYYYGYNTYSTTSTNFDSRVVIDFNFLGNNSFKVWKLKNDNSDLFEVATQIDSVRSGNSSFGNNPMYIFWSSGYGETNNYSKWNGRLYYCNVTSSSSYRNKLIPVRVGNVGYMYDTLNHKLFGNEGTGDFILGPDVS